MISCLFVFFLPILSFLMGIYLVYRGITRIDKEHKSTSGVVETAEPIPSHVSKKDCVYSKVVVEYYSGGPTPWKNICTIEKSAPFRINGIDVDPGYADVDSSDIIVYRGYVRSAKGFFSDLSIETTKEIADFSKEVSALECLDESKFKALLEDQKVKQKIRPHLKRALRITEYIIANGARISVAQDPAIPYEGRFRGTLEYPLVISDNADVSKSMREKALTSIFAGIILIAISVGLLAFILFA